LFSILAEKKGTRITAAIGLILSGLSTVVFALASSWPVFAVASILVQFFAGSILLSVVPNTLMNVWFPTIMGLGLGWASLGMRICTASFVGVVAALIAMVGPATTYLMIAIILVVFGIISVFWVKDTPEAVGCTPDNIHMTPEELAKSNQAFKSKTTMTVRAVMKDKRAWAIGIGLGLMWMTTVGIVSRLIPRLLSLGYEQSTALTMLTIAALCGIFGSYCWGWLDQKFGTRKTSVIYGLWYIIALILLMVPHSHVVTMIAIVIVGIGIGGIGNLVPSMIGTVYGRKDYLIANRFIMPLCTIIRSCAFALMSFAIAITNGYTGAYGIFIGACIVGIIVIWCVGKSGDKPVNVVQDSASL
ncbi:MAG: MFS transporter, partial [Klebsiella quasipneumoniae]|nr:MFS transporter [Klebsiella quasipneumoniae]